LQLIYDREKDDKSLSLGVFNARKSSQDLLHTKRSEIMQLSSWILDAVITMNETVIGPDSRALDDDIVAEAWAVVYRNEGYHKIHTHHDAAWSGVYYVSTGDMEKGSGQIQFIDPRPTALAVAGVQSGSVHRIEPEPGLLVAFPSWLPHSVASVQCSKPRVCIAFNAAFKNVSVA
jgi:uncharacterized protein (TIGR02466 family)